VCGRRPAGARGPCGRHLVESRGPLIAAQGLCAHVFVIADGSVAASSPRGSSVEPDHAQPSPNLPMRQNPNPGIYYASLHGKMEGLVRVIKNREWETAPVVVGRRRVVENMVEHDAELGVFYKCGHHVRRRLFWTQEEHGNDQRPSHPRGRTVARRDLRSCLGLARQLGHA